MSDGLDKLKSEIYSFVMGGRDPHFVENYVDPVGKWLDFGGLKTRNCFPQQCIYLYDNSPTMAGLVTNKSKYVAGKEITFSNPEAAAFAETLEFGEGFQRMFKRAALSMELFGGFALQVQWNQELPIVGGWTFEPFENVRRGFAKAQNEDNKYPQGFYISPEWGFVLGAYATSSNYTPQYYDAFDPKKPNHNKPVYYYFTVDSPGRRWYPLPEWKSAFNAILREIRIGELELAVLENGAFPSGLIQLPRKVKDAEGRDIAAYLKNELTGASNAGRMIVVPADGDDVVSFTPFSSVINSNDMTSWKRNAQTDILQAFRLPSPILIGLPSGQAMFDSGIAMESAVKVYYERDIIPTQNMLIREFEKMFKYAGYETKIFIDQEVPEFIHEEIAEDFRALKARINAPNDPTPPPQSVQMSEDVKRRLDSIERLLRKHNRNKE